MKEVGVRIKVGTDGLENITKLGDELEAAGGSAKLFDAEAKRLADELARLGREQGLIDQFKKTKTAVLEAGTAMDAAQADAKALAREITATVVPTTAQATAMDKVRTAARAAEDAYQAQRVELKQLAGQLAAAGTSADQLAAAEVRVRQQTQTARDGVATLTTTLRSQVDAYRSTGEAATAAATKQKAATTTALDGVKDVGAQLQRLQSLASVAIGGGIFTTLLKDAATTADEFSNLQSRIKLVTGEGPAFVSAFGGIFEVAKRTSSSLESTGTLFARIAQAGKEIGVGQADALKLTETINQAVQLSGASAEASNAAITQLIQGLQSGTLRGDEFNSVMEQAPRLAQALASGLGVGVGALRQMAEQGQLTSETVIRALQGQSDAVATEFEKLPPTVGRALQNLSSEWSKFIGELNQGSGATTAVAAGINKIADNLDTVAGIAERAGAVLVAALAVQGVNALRKYAAEARVATRATGLLSTSIENIPKSVNIVVAIAGLEAAYQFGTFLYENSELARKFGIGVTEFFVNLVSDLQFLKEAAQAIFTDDTVGAAFDRYKQRADGMRENFAGLYEDAKNAPEVVRAAAASAGAATSVQGIGQAADTAAGAIAALGGGAAKVGTALPALGASADAQAAKLADLAGKSAAAGKAIGTDIPEAIKKLSGTELDKFRATMEAALQGSINQSRQLAQSLDAVGKSSGKALAEAQAKGELLKQVLVDTGKQAAESLGVDLSAAGKTLSAEFTKAQDNLSVLIRSMPALKAAGIDAGGAVAQAISKMIDGAKSQAEIDAIKTRLEAMGKKGQLSGAQVAGGLKEAADKAVELKQKLEDATPGIQSLGEAARKAGVDIGELTTGVSKSFKDSVQQISDLRTELEKAGTSAQKASPLLAAALDQRIAAAKTKEEVELLRIETEKLGASGKLAGTDYTNALDKIKAKAQELSPALKQAQEDAKRLGLQLKDNVQKGAESGVEGAIRAYERLKSGGKASAGETQTAFVNMANEIIKANGGIVPEWVKVEAATRGAKIAVDEYGRATVSAAAVAGEALNKLAAGIENSALKKRNESVKSVLGQNEYDKEGFALDAQGNRLTVGGQVKVPEGAQFDQAAFLRAERAAVLSGLKSPNPQDYFTQPGPKPADAAELRTPDSAADTARSARAPSPRPAAPAPQALQPVVINLGGGRSESINVGSKAEADVLTAVLEQLQSGKTRAAL